MLDISDHDGIRTIQLNRPPVNALNMELLSQLAQAVDQAPNEGAKGIVLAGLPGMFSAGLDLKALQAAGPSGIEEIVEALNNACKSLAKSPVPVAAAISGHAPAGGMVLSLFCDYRVMADGEFSIGLNEVRLKIPIPPLAMVALEQVVGLRNAKIFSNEGDFHTPQQAQEMGLIDEIVSADQLIQQASSKLAKLIEFQSPAALAIRRFHRRVLIEQADLLPAGLPI
jgi:enoyl-CoA hydratase/carnithine racemase